MRLVGRSWVFVWVVLVALVFAPVGGARPELGARAASCGIAPNCNLTVATFKMIDSTSGPTSDPPHLGGDAVWAIQLSPMSPDPCSVVDVGLLVTAGPNKGAYSETQQARYGVDAYVVSYVGRNPGVDTVRITVSVDACTAFGPYTVNNSATYVQTASVGWGYDFRDDGRCNNPPAEWLHNAAGRAAYRSQCVNEPISAGLGSFETAVTDATVPSVGAPFVFRRSYSSQSAPYEPLGRGWTMPLFSMLRLEAGSASIAFGTGLDRRVIFTRNQDGSFTPPSWSADKLTQSGSQYTLEQPDHTKFVYTIDPRAPSYGYLGSMIDRNGNTTSVTWAIPDLLVPSSVRLANGKMITFSHSGDLVTQMTLPDGRSVHYGYDQSGAYAANLTSVTDLRGGVTQYSYDGSHRLLTVTDPKGHVVVSNSYGNLNRVVAQTDALGNTTRYEWTPASAAGGLATLKTTDPRGNIWTDHYSADGLLVDQTDPLGDKVSQAWDSSSSDPTGYTDALGNTASFSSNAQHALTGVALPDGSSTSSTYTAGGDLASFTDGRGNVTRYGYDANANLTSVTDADGKGVSFAYDASGELTGVTDRAGATSGFGYDAAGNLTSSATPLGHQTSYGYDASGRVTSITDPRGGVTQIAYDAGDEVTSVTDPLGHTTGYVYDADGNLISRTDPNGQAWQYGYDPDNRLIQVTDPAGGTTSYGYDEVGNLVSRTDANGHATTYAYDAANRLVGVLDPLNRSWTLSYNADGNLTQVVTPSGGTISYGYDQLGRQVSTSYSDGTPSVSLAFDAAGNRVSMSDGTGSASYSYDTLNRLTSRTSGADTFTYSYDADGRVASRTYPDGTKTTYSYDADGNLVSADTGGQTTSCAYDAAGELVKTTLPNGVVQTRSYDAAGQLTHYADGARTVDYAYDPAGNITSRSLDGVSESFSYDALDRLNGATGATDIQYAYDPLGNRTSMTDASGTTSYSYDNAGELLQATGPSQTTTYGYDANGNETQAGAWSYSFDLAGRLTSASDGKTSLAYGYDGDGNLVSSSDGKQAVETLLWDPNFALPQLALERDSSGATLRDYLYGAGPIGLIAPQAHGQNTVGFYGTDGVGSIIDLTGTGSGKKQTLASYDWGPYGVGGLTKKSAKDLSNPLGYTGQFIDSATGLVDLRARQYDPQTGRFLSPDPLGQYQTPTATTDPGVSGGYMYTGDNPLRYTDPSGLAFGKPCTSFWCLAGETLQTRQVSCALLASSFVFGVGEAVTVTRSLQEARTAAEALGVKSSPYAYLLIGSVVPGANCLS